MALALELVVQQGLSPAASLAADRALLAEAADPARRATGVLRVYDLVGDVLSLGRFHLAPDAPPSAPIAVWRRHSGGRAMPWGDGFVGVSLVLPHRSALVSSDPLALAPDQVLNRCVRGILGACELAGVPAVYPGRDVVTVDRRTLALVSFEVDANGALLFEAVIANRRDASVLPRLLDAADPRGRVKAAMVTPADTTCLAAPGGRELDVAEVAALLRRGYERRLDVTVAERTLGDVPSFDDVAWLAARRWNPALRHHALASTQLGVFEAYTATEAGRIGDVVLAGDFIANSGAIERLEDALRGVPTERAAIEATVGRVLGAPESFVLGVRPVATIADTIARSVSA